jgi:hypothetical protein
MLIAHLSVISQINKSTGALGGNGATGAIYGELTMNSMQKIVNYLVVNCGLTSKSRYEKFPVHSVLLVRKDSEKFGNFGIMRPSIHLMKVCICRHFITVNQIYRYWRRAGQA